MISPGSPQCPLTSIHINVIKALCKGPASAALLVFLTHQACVFSDLMPPQAGGLLRWDPSPLVHPADEGAVNISSTPPSTFANNSLPSLPAHGIYAHTHSHTCGSVRIASLLGLPGENLVPLLQFKFLCQTSVIAVFIFIYQGILYVGRKVHV